MIRVTVFETRQRCFSYKHPHGLFSELCKWLKKNCISTVQLGSVDKDQLFFIQFKAVSDFNLFKLVWDEKCLIGDPNDNHWNFYNPTHEYILDLDYLEMI